MNKNSLSAARTLSNEMLFVIQRRSPREMNEDNYYTSGAESKIYIHSKLYSILY